MKIIFTEFNIWLKLDTATDIQNIKNFTTWIPEKNFTSIVSISQVYKG